MKTLTLVLTLILSSNLFADCRPALEQDITKRLVDKKQATKTGLMTTGASFVSMGLFSGYIAGVLGGSFWIGTAIGTGFGAFAALPVGATFLVANKISQKKIKNRVGTLNIISESILGEVEPKQFEKLLTKLNKDHPNLTREDLSGMIVELNESGALCDGTISKSRKIKFASPKQIFKFLNKELSSGKELILM